MLITIFTKANISRKYKKKTKQNMLSFEEQDHLSEKVLESEMLNTHNLSNTDERIKTGIENHIAYKDIINEDYENNNLGYSADYIPID